VKTLVIGAGIAGLTLGGLLCRQERPPVIVERSASPADGYAIGLYPLGRCVLHGLGAYRELAARSLVLERYELSAGSGWVLQSLDMSVLTGAVGPLLRSAAVTWWRFWRRPARRLTGGCLRVHATTPQRGS